MAHPTNLIPTGLHLQRPCFKVISLLQIWELVVRPIFLVDRTHPITMVNDPSLRCVPAVVGVGCTLYICLWKEKLRAVWGAKLGQIQLPFTPLPTKPLTAEVTKDKRLKSTIDNPKATVQFGSAPLFTKLIVWFAFLCSAVFVLFCFVGWVHLAAQKLCRRVSLYLSCLRVPLVEQWGSPKLERSEGCEPVKIPCYVVASDQCSFDVFG